MAKDRVSWRDAYPEEVTCVRCLELKSVMELDRLLWCDECRFRARERAAWWGWLGGLVFAASLALYVWIAIRPTDLIIGGWLGTLAAAVWIGAKVCRELVYGVMRFRNSAAVDASPPVLDDEDASP